MTRLFHVDINKILKTDKIKKKKGEGRGDSEKNDAK